MNEVFDFSRHNRLWSVRGAVCVPVSEQTPDQCVEIMTTRVGELIGQLIVQNKIHHDAIVNIQFTQTADVDYLNAAAAARNSELSQALSHIALFCAQEPEYPNSLVGTIRVLITYYHAAEHQPKPAYLHGAQVLRRDLFHG